MPYQDDLRRYFGEIARYAEPALTAGSAAIAEPVSGLVGLGALLRGRGVDGAVQSINAAQQAMTYQPRTMEGQQGLQGLQAFLQPVGEVIQGASQNLGDKAYSATGSPALAAAAYSAPTAFLEGLGLKGLNIARKPVSGADLYTPRSFGGNIQNFRAPDFELDPSELADVGAEVSDGFVTLYHRTTPDNAEAIKNSGKFSTKEDGVFFSTALEGQAKDYGAGVVKVKVPVSMLQLDDIFDDEAHVRVPMKKAGSIDLSSFIPKDEKPATGASAVGDDGITVFRGVGEGSDDSIIKWVSPDEGIAKGYAKARGGNVESTTVKINNPAKMGAASRRDKPASLISSIIRDASSNKGYDVDAAKQARKEFIDYFGNEPLDITDLWSTEEAKGVTSKMLKSLGYDAISVTEQGVDTYGLIK